MMHFCFLFVALCGFAIPAQAFAAFVPLVVRRTSAQHKLPTNAFPVAAFGISSFLQRKMLIATVVRSSSNGSEDATDDSNTGSAEFENSDSKKMIDLLVFMQGNMTAQFHGINTRFDGINTRFDGVKAEIAGIKADLAGVKVDLAGVKVDLAGVKVDLDTRFTNVTAEIAGVKADLKENTDAIIWKTSIGGGVIGGLFTLLAAFVRP